MYEINIHNDITPDDMELVNQHKELCNQGQYSSAVQLLNDNNFNKGIRASIFNKLEQKIRDIQIYLLNKTAKPDEYYSYEEPTEEEMYGKTYWIQPY